VPWFGHGAFLSEILLPHNEHRVVLTKLLNLGLTVANGQWDQRLECAVNAVLPALVAGGLFLLGCRGLRRRREPILMLVLMAAYGLPLSWRNVVTGFHSQQFFLIGLSLGAIVWLPFARTASARWWLGAACAALALGSMASGLLAAAVVIVLLALRIVRREASWLAVAPSFALCAALLLAGLVSRTTIPQHEVLMPRSAPEFAMAVVRSLSWPWSGHPWLAAVLWLPWCLLVPRALAREPGAPGDPSAGKFPLILSGLGGWTLLQVMATAYARGAGAPYPNSRYVDTIVLGQVVNALALLWLRESRSSGPGFRRVLTWTGVAWFAVAGVGAARQAGRSIKVDLPDIHSYCAGCERNVRNYLATGDTDYLKHGEIPYPSASALLERIRIPVLRDLLPVSVRQPLALAADRSGALTRWDSRVRPTGPTGLSVSTPQPENTVTWGSFDSAEAVNAAGWSSAPVNPEGTGYLRFEVAGHAGAPGVALELCDARSRAVLEEVLPGKVPGNAWRTVYVREPPAPFVIVARGAGPRDWLAFTEPVEMGRLSYWAWRTVRNGLWVAAIAAVAAGLILALSEAEICRRPRR
jgi:hypothetical protein